MSLQPNLDVRRTSHLRTPSLSDSLEGASGWIALGLIAVIVVVWMIWSGIHPGFATHDAAFCKSSYANANTPQDTLMVDAQQSLEKSPAALSCGTLRKAGELRP
jgi:hypothetical protein